MKWKKNILTILSFFLISSLILVSFGYAINTTSNDIDPHSNGLADSPWPRWRGNNQGTGLSPYNTSFVEGTEKWNLTLDGQITSSPVIGPDGTIYLCTNKSIHEIRDKKQIWNLSFDGNIPYGNTPAVNSNGNLYITTTRDKIHSINPEGKILWTSQLKNNVVSSTPVIGKNGTIYVSTSYKLHAFNPNGTLKWKIGQEGGVWPIGGYSPVIGNDGNIYFGSRDQYEGSNFFSINKSGKIKWVKRHLGHFFSSSPAVGEDGTIYIGSTRGLHAIHTNGTVKWIFNPNNNSMVSSPAVDKDGNIYAVDSNSVLYSVNPLGQTRWKYTMNNDLGGSLVIGNNGIIYFTDDNSTLHALNSEGNEIWNLSTDEDIGGFSPAIGSDGTLYFTSGNKLYAIGPSSPVVNITSPKKKEIYKDSVTVEWESSTVGTDIDHYEVKIDEKSWIDIGKDSSYKFDDLKEGKQVVKVKAVAGSGNYDIDDIEVTIYTSPELNITTPKKDEIFNTSFLTVEWTSSDGNGIDHHEVQLDDDNWIDVGESTEYTFEELSDEKHTVRVKAIDNTGNSTEKSVNFTVDTTPPTADAGEDIEVGISEQFNLDGSGSTDNIGIESFRWVINDETYNEKVVELSIDEIGDYTAVLTVTDTSGNTDTDSMIVTVMDKTGPKADAGKDRTVKVDEEVTFDASMSSDNIGIESYEWDFGDGTTGNGETVEHKFDEKGTYEVTLTVSDEASNQDTDTVEITVEESSDGGDDNDNGIPGFTLIILLFNLSLVAIYHYRKK